MAEQQHNCISDGEEDPEESQIDPIVVGDNDAEIRKNLFDEFDVATKQKTSTDSSSSGREYMKVYLRIRPFINEEIEAKENQNCLGKESATAVLMNAPKESFAFKNSTRAGGEISHRFSFSNVFSEDTTQKKFFDETTLPLVADFIHGQNCLVFTYGVTNSGKTYTIQGTPKDGGILPRSLDVLFNSIEGKHYTKMNLKPRFCTDVIRLTEDEERRENSYKNALISSLDKDAFDINALLKLDQDLSADVSKANCTAEESMLHNTIKSQDGDVEHELPSMDAGENDSRVVDDTTIDVEAQGPVKFSVWVSFAEIYNEIIYDLLEPCPMGKGKKRTTLRLGDDTNGNPYIKGLREIYVSSADEAYKILKIGQKNQRIASTKLNQCSSRSHCIFSVKVLRVVDVEDPHVARVSRLSFVDLAGSERYSKTHSKGERLKEAGNINTSLMTLGKCLEYLRYNQKNPNQPLIIPFRESKLTRLFQGFFCGKGRASMIVNVNMCASAFDETFHVMKFSAIAKKVTTRVTKPVDMPPPAKKQRALSATPRPKPTRLSIPWANGALCTPAHPVDESLAEINEGDGDEEVEIGEGQASAYQQQLVNLVKALQEKLIEEKRKMQTLEVKIREEVCKEMAEQLVSIENAYSERVKMEVTAVEEKCDRRIELLTQSIKKSRKRARIERIEEQDEEWVPSVFLHAEQTKVQEKQHIISELNAKIAELRQEVKQLKDSRQEETSTSDAVLELQGHLNDANEEVNELKQMLEEAGEAFTEKEAEINKLRAALDNQETCFKNQDEALKHLTKELENAKAISKQADNTEELHQLKGALEVATIKLSETEKNVQAKDLMLKEVVRTLEETREELARERSYVAQAFDNDEELIRIKDELQKAEAKAVELEEKVASKDENINSLKREIEDASARHVEKTTQDEEYRKVLNEKMVEIEKANNVVAALEKQLEDFKEETQSTREELEKFKAESISKDSELELAKNKIKEKTSKLEGATREISENLAALEGMKKQMIEMEAELQSVKEDNLKTSVELERVLEEKLEILAKHKSDDHHTRVTAEPVAGGDAEMVKQASRVKELEEDLREKSIELENTKSEYTRKIDELKTELSGCKTEMNKPQSEDAVMELEQQLEESTKALDKKNSQVIARNNTIKRLELSLAEKDKLLSEMEKLPKEPNLRAKEELKTLRRRFVQAGKEVEETKELLAGKDRKIEETRQELEKIKSENDEKAAAFLKELQAARTELSEVKEDAEKKQEEIKALTGQLDVQRSNNACLQTQLENEKRSLQEKENTVQATMEELNSVRSKSSTEIDDAKKRLESTEEKVHKLEDEVFTANEESSRVQAEVQRYEEEIVPGLENKIKALEEENLRSSLKVKDTEEIMEKNLREARCQLEKRNSEIEQITKELHDLRDSVRTAEKEKFEELDKNLQEMMCMQKTIEERNRTLDTLEKTLRDTNLELEKSKERTKSQKEQLQKLNQEKRSLEERLDALTKKLELLTSDSGKEKETLSNLKMVLQEQDLIMSGQAQAIDERQSEIETLSTDLQIFQEKCSFTEKELERKKSEIAYLKQQTLSAGTERRLFEKMEEEMKKLKEDHSSHVAQLKAKDEEIKNVNDSRDNIMKTMREALEVAKANKAEYEVKLATVREQCRSEMKREMEEEKRRLKRDFQRQLEEKNGSLEEIKCEKESAEKAIAAEKAAKTKSGSSSSDLDTQTDNTDVPASDSEVKSSVLRSKQKRNLKRNSSDLSLAELKNQMSASKSRKKEDSDEEFTPGSVRKTRTRSSTKKAGRSTSTRYKRTTPATVEVLPTMDEKDCKTDSVREKKKLFKDLQEGATSAGEEENVPPSQPSQQSTKKRGKLFHKPSSLTALLSSGKSESRDDRSEQPDKTKTIITRQLRPRSIKYN